MTRHFTLLLGVLALFVAGCASPMQRVLSHNPQWQSNGQHLAAEKNSYSGGLVWQPFPDLNNPVHLEIWKSLSKHGNVGDGYGAICNYYGAYLVAVSVSNSGIYSPASYFYFPYNHSVLDANVQLASTWYKGDREATETNAVSLVEHLLAINEYKSFVIYGPNDIPHTAHLKDNPKLPFEEYLASKSIIITPPSRMRVNGGDGVTGFDGYSVFVYMPCGGEIYRYEVQCSEGHIHGVTRFLLGQEIGDCWYLM